jgi:predicted phage terminase large subunit-like protein
MEDTFTYVPITQEDIDIARREAEKKLGQLTSEQIFQLRIKAKHNLFFLSYGILGYNKLTDKLHKDVCRWAKDTLLDQYTLLLLPRGHYKSTIYTISDSIQVALPDDLHSAPYPRDLGGNVRLLILHEALTKAQKFLSSIQQHFTLNPLMVGLFPECVPDPKKQKININELCLPRDSFWPESTFDTMGVGGSKQGAHYNIVKADDLIGDEARDSKLVMTRAKDFIDNLQSFLTTPATDKINFLGTRWAFDDAYDHIMKMYGDQLKVYVRAVEEYNKETGKKESIFPEKYPPKALEILRKNPKVFNAQYMNDPREGAANFDPSWKRFYNYKGRYIRAFTGQETFEREVSTLDKVILIDPAMNGLAGFVVTGTDFKKNVFILDAQKKIWRPPELVDLIFQAVARWNPRLVVIEKVLFSEVFEFYIQREMQIRGLRFRIEGCPTGGKAKEARVNGLSNYFAAGQIFFNADQHDLIEEFDQFGATDNYHMLDALAQGPKYWKIPVNQSFIDAEKRALEAVDSERDVETGYSTMY